MPEHRHLTTIAGRVTHIFAHRFVVETETGAFLCDVGPKGAAAVSLRRGDSVVLSGEAKPSELKVRRFEGPDGRIVEIQAGETPAQLSVPLEAAPEIVVRALEEAGLKLVGGLRRRPKHFEVLGRRGDGALVEAHVEFDGRIRKTKPADRTDSKWSKEHGEGGA
jgi:hypothetical protein